MYGAAGCHMRKLEERQDKQSANRRQLDILKASEFKSQAKRSSDKATKKACVFFMKKKQKAASTRALQEPVK